MTRLTLTTEHRTGAHDGIAWAECPLCPLTHHARGLLDRRQAAELRSAELERRYHVRRSADWSAAAPCETCTDPVSHALNHPGPYAHDPSCPRGVRTPRPTTPRLSDVLDPRD